MAIHEIINIALREMRQYEIHREEEKLEMIYCMGRIESASSPDCALEALKNHLKEHYQPAHGYELFERLPKCLKI